MTHVVTAPLVIVKNEDGSDRYVYQGAPLPAHVTGDALKHLVDSGLVDSDKSDDKPAGNASLEDWQEFARTKGATDADLDGKTRDELRKQYA